MTTICKTGKAMRFSVVCWICLGLTFVESRTSYDSFTVYQVTPKSIDEAKLLKKYENNENVDFWSSLRILNAPVDIMVSPSAQDGFEDVLKSHNIEYKVLIDNVEEKMQEEINRQRISPRVERGEVTFTEFMRYDDDKTKQEVRRCTMITQESLREKEARQHKHKTKPHTSQPYPSSEQDSFGGALPPPDTRLRRHPSYKLSSKHPDFFIPQRKGPSALSRHDKRPRGQTAMPAKQEDQDRRASEETPAGRDRRIRAKGKQACCAFDACVPRWKSGPPSKTGSGLQHDT